jgi:hypothetical protein
VLALSLGLIQSDVGGAQELEGGGLGCRCEADAEGDAVGQADLAQLQGPREVSQPLGRDLCLLSIRSRQRYEELVASPASIDIVGAPVE